MTRAVASGPAGPTLVGPLFGSKMRACLDDSYARAHELTVAAVFTPHAQRERGKVIGRGVHIYICLWSKKIFESYFRDRLTFSNVDSRTSR